MGCPASWLQLFRSFVNQLVSATVQLPFIFSEPTGALFKWMEVMPASVLSGLCPILLVCLCISNWHRITIQFCSFDAQTVVKAQICINHLISSPKTARKLSFLIGHIFTKDSKKIIIISCTALITKHKQEYIPSRICQQYWWQADIYPLNIDAKFIHACKDTQRNHFCNSATRFVWK